MSDRILLPVAESDTMRRTVAHAVDRATADGDGVIRAVYLPTFGSNFSAREAELEAGRELLDRVERWIAEDVEAREAAVVVETAVIGPEFFPHTPPDVADEFLTEIAAHDIDRIIFDARYDPGVGTNLLASIERIIEAESDAIVEEVGVPEPRRRSRLPRRTDFRRYALLYAIAFGFYLVLAGSLAPFELVTGAATAAIVTITMGGVAFWQPPSPVSTTLRTLRGLVYIPYLLAKIIQANLGVARVILDPRLTIDPCVVRLRPAVYGAFPLTTLANSITLTPGTLSMRFTGQELLVHTLIPAARDDLLSGRLERAVRFVFYGRVGMRAPAPTERDDATVTHTPGGDEGDG